MMKEVNAIKIILTLLLLMTLLLTEVLIRLETRKK